MCQNTLVAGLCPDPLGKLKRSQDLLGEMRGLLVKEEGRGGEVREKSKKS